MSDASTSPPCKICSQEQAPPQSIVFRDDLWAGEIVPGFDVPGWFVLRTRRHAERLIGLHDAELDTMARRARDLTAAVTEVTGAPATYLLVFGENFPHFHAMIAARGDDVPPERRSGEILKLRRDRADFEAACTLVDPVRRVYERVAEQGSHPEPA